MQSTRETPQTPLAMLIPDHGTTPTRRSTERRTQAGDLGLDGDPEGSGSKSESPPRALRVISNARGKSLARKGPRGAESKVAQAEPTVVSALRSTVA